MEDLYELVSTYDVYSERSLYSQAKMFVAELSLKERGIWRSRYIKGYLLQTSMDKR